MSHPPAPSLSRRRLLEGALSLTAATLPLSLIQPASAQNMPTTTAATGGAVAFETKRPAVGKRHFTSPAVEETIQNVKKMIADPELAYLFENCYPNTLDTTVTFQELDGKPDTFVITGDITAMWLRDSSAQVWPYLSLVDKDPKLARLIQGVIHRQSKCILLDPYANAFFSDPNERSEWASDFTVMKPGVHEHKWEIDSLCYPIRLAYGYWQQTGDTAPFDAEWEQAMDAVLQTFKEQQRRDGHGPYYFQRGGPKPNPQTTTQYGPPVNPVGLICSRFRPSDDETTYPFLIPSNLFAVQSLKQMAFLLEKARGNSVKAKVASTMAEDVQQALNKYATIQHKTLGTIYAFEVDALGSINLMDDANVPSLLGLPYLGVCANTDPIYQATRKFCWSKENPWYFEGKFSGIGGPHIGPKMIWPMSLIMYGLTSSSMDEVRAMLKALKASHAGTGFIHESFHVDNPAKFTRSWFAWANTLFGEFVLQTAHRFPEVLKEAL